MMADVKPADRRVHVFVSGRVQGVCFRAYTQAQARELGLAGWVRNLPDGRVELVAEGPQAKVEALVAWCHTGSPYGKVTGVDAQWEEPQGGVLGFRVE